jgi:hypothetical protein
MGTGMTAPVAQRRYSQDLPWGLKFGHLVKLQIPLVLVVVLVLDSLRMSNQARLAVCSCSFLSTDAVRTSDDQKAENEHDDENEQDSEIRFSGVKPE